MGKYIGVRNLQASVESLTLHSYELAPEHRSTGRVFHQAELSMSYNYPGDKQIYDEKLIYMFGMGNKTECVNAWKDQVHGISPELGDFVHRIQGKI